MNKNELYMENKRRKYPTLYVKNFAKIKEAEIELAPFTLFVGDNNSGKSYLMTLVYGFVKYVGKIIDIIFKDEKVLEEFEEYRRAKNIIDNNIKTLDFDKSADLSIKEINIFIDLFNVLLNRYSNEVVNYIFNSNNEITLDYIKLTFNHNKTIDYLKIYKSKKIDDNKEIYYIGIRNIGSETWCSRDKAIYSEILKNIIDTIIDFQVFHNFFYREKIFLPVSRTGFLLSRNDISSSAIVNKFDRYAVKKNNEYLSRPVIDFLNNLNSLNYLYKKNNKIIIIELDYIISFF